MRRLWRATADDRGSAPAEFVMVGALLVTLVVAVLQLALALHVRNTLLDAAAEGARYGALADSSVAAGEARTAELIRIAVGSGYANAISGSITGSGTDRQMAITVTAPLPVIGLLGLDQGVEVTAHAPVETIATD